MVKKVPVLNCYGNLSKLTICNDYRLIREEWQPGVGGGGGGNSNIKKVGVLVVSLRGVNFRFWSRLGC